MCGIYWRTYINIFYTVNPQFKHSKRSTKKHQNLAQCLRVANATEGVSTTPPEKTLLTESSEPPTFSEEVQANLEKEVNDTYSTYPKDLIRETTPLTEENSPAPNENTSSLPFASPQTGNDSAFNTTLGSKLTVTQQSSNSSME